MKNPFKRDPEKVAAAKAKDQARRDRRAEATRQRDEKFAAINARYAASKATVAEQRELAREQFNATIAANTERYQSKIDAINESKADPGGLSA